MPEPERARIEAELAAVTDSFQAAIIRRDAVGYLSIFAPAVELRFVRDGQLVSGLHDQVRAQFDMVRSMQCEWPARTVTVLASTAASVTFTYRCSGENSDGAKWTGSGAWTNVFQRRGDRWVVREAHESHPGNR